jgi:hypothetical protein
MPRFPLVAISASKIFLFDGPLATRPPFAILPRDAVRVIYGGNAMWRRLDLITDGDAGGGGEAAGQRCYTIMVSVLGSRKRLEQLVAELERTGAPG